MGIYSHALITAFILISREFGRVSLRGAAIDSRVTSTIVYEYESWGWVSGGVGEQCLFTRDGVFLNVF